MLGCRRRAALGVWLVLGVVVGLVEGCARLLGAAECVRLGVVQLRRLHRVLGRREHQRHGCDDHRADRRDAAGGGAADEGAPVPGPLPLRVSAIRAGRQAAQRAVLPSC